jgi:4-hydroxy-3-methylbut-2-enyl diphosphate reductase
MRIEVISPHGFCGGVERAVKMAREALAANRGTGASVFCLHVIVHNEDVTKELAAEGMRFVESVDDVPQGATMLISAHGVAPAVREAAEARGLRVIDATCPFVDANHRTIRENFRKGMRTAVVGSPGHDEVRGYLGEPGACLPGELKDGETAGKVVQTTLDADVHGGVCTATADRQRAVRRFAEGRPGAGVLVVGGARSANSVRLVEIAQGAGAKAWLVASAAEAEAIDAGGVEELGVTSGASTPEGTFRAVVEVLEARNGGGEKA